MVINGSGHDLLPIRHQAITWNIAIFSLIQEEISVKFEANCKT